MCRNIKRLRHADHAPTDAELHDAALQFIRKISGFHTPSRTNQAAFDRAVRDVAAVSRTLFRSLHLRQDAGREQGSGQVALPSRSSVPVS